MQDLVVALGLVFGIEGIIYGAFPAFARRLAGSVLDMSENSLRYGGLAAMVAGVAIVWLARG
jgi:uncharacterized protein YjeT (DUF2065 family)